jgi:hypothetical protein
VLFLCLAQGCGGCNVMQVSGTGNLNEATGTALLDSQGSTISVGHLCELQCICLVWAEEATMCIIPMQPLYPEERGTHIVLILA